jgi:hypothetical protein
MIEQKSLVVAVDGQITADSSMVNFLSQLESEEVKQSQKPWNEDCDLLIVDWNKLLQNIETSILDFLSERPAVLLFIPKVPLKPDQLALVLEHRANVLSAEVYPKHEMERWFLYKRMRSHLQYLRERSKFRHQLESLTTALKTLTNDVEQEVHRVKGLHRKLIPRRFEDIKGLKLHGKFLAGEFPGGEYFDLCRSQRSIVLMMCSTSSYLLSSAFISSFFKFKGSSSLTFDSLKDLKNMLDQDFLYLKDTDTNIQREYLLLHVDLTTMNLHGIVRGGYRMISCQKGNLLQGIQQEDHQLEFHEQLQRGERVSLISPGLLKNWKTYMENKDLITFVKENQEVDLVDFVEELMIQVKMNTGKDFLDFDASTVAMEVSENVILQV